MHNENLRVEGTSMEKDENPMISIPTPEEVEQDDENRTISIYTTSEFANAFKLYAQSQRRTKSAMGFLIIEEHLISKGLWPLPKPQTETNK